MHNFGEYTPYTSTESALVSFCEPCTYKGKDIIAEYKVHVTLNKYYDYNVCRTCKEKIELIRKIIYLKRIS